MLVHLWIVIFDEMGSDVSFFENQPCTTFWCSTKHLVWLSFHSLGTVNPGFQWSIHKRGVLSVLNKPELAAFEEWKRLMRGLCVYQKTKSLENQSTAVLIRSLCTQQCLIGCVFCPELSLRDTAKAVGQTSTGSICDAGQEGEAKHWWLRFSGKLRAE